MYHLEIYLEPLVATYHTILAIGYSLPQWSIGKRMKFFRGTASIVHCSNIRTGCLNFGAILWLYILIRLIPHLMTLTPDLIFNCKVGYWCPVTVNQTGTSNISPWSSGYPRLIHEIHHDVCYSTLPPVGWVFCTERLQPWSQVQDEHQGLTPKQRGEHVQIIKFSFRYINECQPFLLSERAA